jgi:hypothetical protein
MRGGRADAWLSGSIKRHPIITFFVLTYVITWSFVPFGSFGAFGPLLAAVIVAPLTRGRSGLKELGLRMIRWPCAGIGT